MLLTFLNTLATIISVISLLIVTYGVLVCFIAFLRNEIKRFNGTYTVNNIRQLRADFGTYLLLGLEFLIASDILKTVVDPTLDELAILGGGNSRGMMCLYSISLIREDGTALPLM